MWKHYCPVLFPLIMKFHVLFKVWSSHSIHTKAQTTGHFNCTPLLMLVLKGDADTFRWKVNIFLWAWGLVCTIMNKMNQTQLSGHKLIPAVFFQVLSASVKVFLCVVRWELTHPCPPSTFSVYISHPHTPTYSRSQQAAGSRTLPHLGRRPWRFSWQGPALVTGLAPVTGLF